MERIRTKAILRDLEKKMVFLVGPRQSGKTWLARRIGEGFAKTVYLNCDSRPDRTLIERGAWLPDAELLILDELHKMSDWKNKLKGIWDTRPSGQRIMVTGSARLDTWRQSGDSLAGRFFSHRLLPFSPAELSSQNQGPSIERLLDRAGFPEPFLTTDETEARRWRSQYVDGLLREDILDFRNIGDLRSMRLVLEILRERVGSPLSYSSIARDIGVSPNTVIKYVSILEALFIVFLITPYSKNIARSLLKEPKIYFYDIGMVKGDRGLVFENLVALSLLQDVWARNDLEAAAASLHYIRTKDGDEIDFCLARNGEPVALIEAKLADDEPSRPLRKFAARFPVKSIQVVKDLKHEYDSNGIELRRAADWLAELRA